MEVNVYNIIWVDDDIEALSSNPVKARIMKDEHIHLLDKVKTSTDLRYSLNLYGDSVDAVITDGNFDKRKSVLQKDDETTSGLTDVLNIIETVNSKRFIPFYLYTGKSKLLYDKYPDSELEYFEKNHRMFEKAEFPQMIMKIKEDVDRINSPHFRIHNKYAKEFEAAKNIEDAVRYLSNGLLYLYDEGSWKDVQDYFNPARKIVERIKNKCIEMNILPQKTSLNNASRIFSGVDTFIGLKEEYMPKTLAESFFYFLKITQDGSHDENDLSLGVDKYVRENKNINLYRTILYISMDLLLWFDSIQSRFKDNHDPLWKDKYIYEGEVCTGFDRGRKYFYTKNYELQQNKDLELKDGDVVRIYKSEKKEHQKGNTSEFVKRDNYRKK